MSDSRLADAVLDTLKMARQLRAAGTSEAELQAALVAVLKDTWPHERAWKTLCDACDDYGLRMFTCTGAANCPCGRGRVHQQNSCGDACWCAKGERFRAQKRSEIDDIARAAKTKSKTKSFTRFGS